jgi:hypothetical protein
MAGTLCRMAQRKHSHNEEDLLIARNSTTFVVAAAPPLQHQSQHKCSTGLDRWPGREYGMSGTRRFGFKVISRRWYAGAAACLMLAQTGQAQGSDVSAAISGGLAYQSDAVLYRGIQLSPVGIVAGVSVAGASRAPLLGLSARVALYPAIRGDRRYHPVDEFDTDTAFDKSTPLSIGTLAIDVGPRTRGGGISWFASTGISGAMSSPRRGSRYAAMFGAGANWRSVRLAVEATVRPLGRTVVQIPITVSFRPLR